MIQIVKMAIDYIENHLNDKIKIEDISKEVNCSVRTLQRCFKKICKYDISEYILNRKLSKILDDLEKTDLTINEIALKYGYQNSGSLTRIFVKKFSVTPSQYRIEKMNIEKFDKIDTSRMFDLKKYSLIDYYVERKENIILYGIKNEFLIKDDVLLGKDNKFYQLLKMNEKKISSLYEILYIDDKVEKCCKGKFIDNKLEKNYDVVKELLIPKTEWLVCKAKSKVSYEEAVMITLYMIEKRISIEYWEDFGYYHDFDFSDRNKITNICVNKGYDNKNGEYYCEVWIPVKEDFFVKKNCKTCADAMVCEVYSDMTIDQLIKKYPNGCNDFKYSLDDYIMNEEIRVAKAKETFKNRSLYRLLYI